MGEPSVERRFVGGAWRWVIREEPSGGSVAFKGAYTFAFDDANLDAPRALFTPAADDLVVLVTRYVEAFDDGAAGIADAQLYVFVGDTELLPAGGNRLQIEGDIETLDGSGDAYVLPADGAAVPFFPGGTNGSTFVASMKNAAPVTAYVADDNGDPIGTAEDIAPTQGRIDLFFLVYSPSA